MQPTSADRPAYWRPLFARVPRTLGRRPQLDGLRALAFAAVFIGHAGLTSTPGIARIAMYLFFGLSGFLIAALLSEEAAGRHAVSLPRFFARRGLRLFPALVVFLAVWLLAVLLFGSQPWMTTVPGSTASGGQQMGSALAGSAAALFYVSNWVDIFQGLGGHLALGHLWSLAVEEQFYLLWAPVLAVLLVGRKRACVPVSLIGAAGSVVLAVWLQHLGHVNENYMGTGSRSGAFLVGAAFALLWRRGWLSVLRYRFAGLLVIVVSVIALLECARPLVQPSSLRQFGLAWTIATLAGPLLVVASVEQTTGIAFRALAHPIVSYVGRRSYALYLWHYLFLTWFRDLGAIGIGVALATTFLVAEVSWRLVEAPFLRMKQRFTVGREPSREEAGSQATGSERSEQQEELQLQRALVRIGDR